MQQATHSVIVLDMFHYMDAEHEITIFGFTDTQAAREYAKRRTRDSLEQLRPESKTIDELHRLWFSFGEDCLVQGDNYAGAHDIEYFLNHPASSAERDWVSLTPNQT